MTDLSKLPWGELKLPAFGGRKVIAGKALCGNFVYIEAEGYCQIAHQIEPLLRRWDLIDRRFTVDEIEQIAKMCRMVEEFIEKHGGQNGGSA